MKSSKKEKNKLGSELDRLTQGSTWTAIWIMSWPLLVSTVTTSVVELIDTYIAGDLGSKAQAAVGISEQILFMSMVFTMALTTGTTALVSRAAGAKNQEEVDASMGQSILFAIVMSLILASIVSCLGYLLVPLLSKDPELINLANQYLPIIALFLIPWSVGAVINSGYRSVGDAIMPLIVSLIMAVINIGGDILTVRMNWPVPGLGIKGIAFSAVAGSLIAFCFNLYMFSRSELAGSLKKILPFSADYLRRLVNICLPTALQKFSWTLASFVLFFVLSMCPKSTSAIASWSIGMRVEALVFMPLLALSLAISAIIGQNLGAKQVERAKKAGWQMTGIGVVLMLVLASLMYFNASSLAMTMSHDPVAIGYTISYLQINALADPFLASGMILSGALQGAGDTRVTMWISIFANWIIRLPLAYVFAIFLSLGPTGVWIAMASSQVLSAFLLSARFKSGDWVKVQV